MRFLSLTIVVFFLASCATFKPKHDSFIDPAISLQAEALSDSRFEEILLELDDKKEIVWNERLRDFALIETNSFGGEMAWFLRKYRDEGGLTREKLKPWRKLNIFSATTASYNPKTDFVKLNLNKFNKDKFALANTFVHEKNHSFGLIHDNSQTRNNNKCDAGYIAGDLAEALLRSRYGNNDSTPHTPRKPKASRKVGS